MRRNEFTVELGNTFRIFAFNVAEREQTMEKLDEDRDVVVRDVEKDIEPTGIRIVANPRLELAEFRRLLGKCVEMMNTCTDEQWQETIRAARAEVERERVYADEPF